MEMSKELWDQLQGTIVVLVLLAACCGLVIDKTERIAYSIVGLLASSCLLVLFRIWFTVVE